MTPAVAAVRRPSGHDLPGRDRPEVSRQRPACPLHPLAWWIWALGLATAASRTTNPLLLMLVLAVAGLVVGARRTTAHRSRAYRSFLVLGLVVVVIRAASAGLLGTAAGPTVLVRLPELGMPAGFAGIRIGGPVSAESLVTGAVAGLQLATLLSCVGAANALADPLRMLKVVPGALYEVGVAVVVAVSVAPQLLGEVSRVQAARRLRGRSARGLRALGQTAVPVLHGALERSLALAASMDARGYGRMAATGRAVRLAGGAAALSGLVAVLVGVYGLLAGGPVHGPGPGSGAVLAAGVALVLVALGLGSRRSIRTRYRPDPWRLAEWLVAGSGVLAAVTLLVMAGSPTLSAAALSPATVPLTAPGLPSPAAVAILLAAVPAVIPDRR